MREKNDENIPLEDSEETEKIKKQFQEEIDNFARKEALQKQKAFEEGIYDRQLSEKKLTEHLMELRQNNELLHTNEHDNKIAVEALTQLSEEKGISPFFIAGETNLLSSENTPE